VVSGRRVPISNNNNNPNSSKSLQNTLIERGGDGHDDGGVGYQDN
jgi:hypothetical protein